MEYNDVAERITKLGLNEDTIVYQLSVADAVCVIADYMTEEEFNNLTDSDLRDAIEYVIGAFQHIAWSEYGEAGLSNWKFDGVRKKEGA